MREPLRVLHITPTFRPSIGGIEAVIESLSDHLAARQVVADVAHVHRAHTFGQTEHRGHCVWRVPLYGHPFAGLAPALKTIARDYDLIHVHDPQLLAISASVAVFARAKPAVLSTHGGFHHTEKFAHAKTFHQRVLLACMLRRYRRVLASSKADLVYFSRFADHVALTENGVDVARFAGIKSNSDRSPWNWLYWGRLSRNKRLDLAVRLASRGRQLGYPVTFTICGPDFDGTGADLRQSLDPETQSFVTLLDAANDEALVELIARSGMFVTASEHEGFGLTVIEAMAAGLVVICRDITPLNGFVDDACGLLLAFDDSEADHERLGSFLDRLTSEHQEMQANARARAQRFDWPRATDRFLEQYRLALETDGTCDARQLVA